MSVCICIFTFQKLSGTCHTAFYVCELHLARVPPCQYICLIIGFDFFFFLPFYVVLLWKTFKHWAVKPLGSLSTPIFETRTANGSELLSLLSCLHTTTFTLQKTFSSLEMISIKIWETSLSLHAKCSLPVAVRVSKMRVLKLPVLKPRRRWAK